MSKWQDIGVGPTDELSLRVSVASLARVTFEKPGDGKAMLALERKVTFLPSEGYAILKTQPFGGALRIHNLLPLKEIIGDFHFDSHRSRTERDFRIYIRPAAWSRLRDFCLEQFGSPERGVLESIPDRELAEEFKDALGIDLSPDQYRGRALWTILENEPAPTGNIHAPDKPTVRIYLVFEVRITDTALVDAMISNSRRYSNRDLQSLANADAREGGKNGRANAFLIVPMEALISFYHAMSPERRNTPATFDGFLLEPNVTAILDRVLASKYQRV